jgi:dienelactone hydrolase
MTADADAGQLALFCGYCQGSGTVKLYATDADLECVAAFRPCPACHPPPKPSARELWLAAVKAVQR